MKRSISQNIAERPLNITSILNNFKSLIKQVKKDAAINLTRKTIKMSASEPIQAKGRKNYFH